jgi:hypothetical protein
MPVIEQIFRFTFDDSKVDRYKFNNDLFGLCLINHVDVKMIETRKEKEKWHPSQFTSTNMTETS